MTKEAVYHAYAWNMENRTFFPAFITEGEVSRVRSYGGASKTPQPLILRLYEDWTGDRERPIPMHHLLIAIAFNREVVE